MNFLKNNREMLVVALVVTGMFAMAISAAYSYRGGNPRAPMHFSWGR